MRKKNDFNNPINARLDGGSPSIRTGTVHDRGQILHFIRSMLDEMAVHGGREVADSRTVWSDFEARLAGDIKAGNYLFLLAEEPQGNMTVGLLAAYLTRPEPIFVQSPGLHISAVYVAPSARRQGLASEMLRRALEWGKQKGVVEAQLHVLAHNPAQNLYARFGFEPFEHTLLLKLGGQKEPEQ